jgi:hypothetical protein
MVAWIGVIVIVAAWAAGLAWIANSAASRGRSQVVWTTVAVLISAVWFFVIWGLPITSPRDMELAGAFAWVLAPLVGIFLSLLALGRWLRRQPVNVPNVRVWPVSCRTNGNGKLEITDETVRLTWDDRTLEFPRRDVRSATQDGECLRLAWTDGELVLLPMLPPQNREARIEQSQTLARLLLAPSLPTAIQVNRR